MHDRGSGYVTLRSTVTDSRGDAMTETIYRAYVIAG
jgi:Flocculin repeat